MTEGGRILLRRLYESGSGTTRPSKDEAIRLLAAVEREVRVRERMDLSQTLDEMEHHEHSTGPQTGQFVRLGEIKRVLVERDEIDAALSMEARAAAAKP